MTGDRVVLAHDLDADLPDLGPEARVALLGAKGAGLHRMRALGLPVPPGFTLTTVACQHHREHGWDAELDAALRHHLARLEATTGRRLGDARRPLLVSVRSGAAVSMPGMLDTVLDVGMTDAVAAGLAAEPGQAAFARDTAARARRSWDAVVRTIRPGDPAAQVAAAARAVFDSWGGDRAQHYRRVEGIDASLGTAVTVQAMVFGNRDRRSGTGVALSRDPTTGATGPVGDFLPAAQGEDVVDGARETRPLDVLAEHWPDVWAELVAALDRLEHELDDAVEVELTVESGRLWLLQVRRASRGPLAELRVALDLADDPTFALDRAGAVARCRHLLDADRTRWRPATDGALADDASAEEAAVVARGVAAAPGRAVGVLATDIARAIELHAEGVDVVLARSQTSPADVHGLAAAVGLVTTVGGLASHAAVVARSWGLPAVVGATELRIVADGVDGPGGAVAEGEVVTLDGDGGRLLRGRHPGRPQEPPELAVLRDWATEVG